MSINIYNYIIKKLPDDLIKVINEYCDPEITWLYDKVEEVIKKEPDLKISLQKKNLLIIKEYLKLIPLIYIKSDKNVINQEEKHIIENFYYNCRDLTTFDTYLYLYVDRRDLIIAFIISGFTCYKKYHARYDLNYEIKARLQKRKFQTIQNRIEKYIVNTKIYENSTISIFEYYNKRREKRLEKLRKEKQQIQDLYFSSTLK